MEPEDHYVTRTVLDFDHSASAAQLMPNILVKIYKSGGICNQSSLVLCVTEFVQ